MEARPTAAAALSTRPVWSTRVRTTGLSISYNLGVTLFGGFAPIVLTWLISASGSLLSPSYYFMAVAVVSICGLLVIRSRGYVDGGASPTPTQPVGAVQG